MSPQGCPQPSRSHLWMVVWLRNPSCLQSLLCQQYRMRRLLSRHPCSEPPLAQHLELPRSGEHWEPEPYQRYCSAGLAVWRSCSLPYLRCLQAVSRCWKNRLHLFVQMPGHNLPTPSPTGLSSKRLLMS